MTAFGGWAIILGGGVLVLALILRLVERSERLAERRRDRLRDRLYAQQFDNLDERLYREAIRREVGIPLGTFDRRVPPYAGDERREVA